MVHLENAQLRWRQLVALKYLIYLVTAQDFLEVSYEESFQPIA